MKLASKSAIESESSAKEGSNASRGTSEAPLRDALPDSRSEEREDGRRGVVGRDIGRRVAEVERWLLLPAWGVVDEDMIGRECQLLEDLEGCTMLLTLQVEALPTRREFPSDKSTPVLLTQSLLPALLKCSRGQNRIMQKRGTKSTNHDEL